MLGRAAVGVKTLTESYSTVPKFSVTRPHVTTVTYPIRWCGMRCVSIAHTLQASILRIPIGCRSMQIWLSSGGWLHWSLRNRALHASVVADTCHLSFP